MRLKNKSIITYVITTYWDKPNGNTYHSATVLVNTQRFHIPYQYGQVETARVRIMEKIRDSYNIPNDLPLRRYPEFLAELGHFVDGITVQVATKKDML